MLKPLKQKELYRKLQSALTYLMYHKNELGIFFTGLIRETEIRIVDAIPGGFDAAVTMKNTHPVMLLSPGFFERRVKEQVLTLFHEYRHLIFEHLLIYKEIEDFYVSMPGIGKVSAKNLGMDAAINDQEIQEDVPPTWILPATFGAPRGKSWLFYFEWIRNLAKGGEGDGQPDQGSGAGKTGGAGGILDLDAIAQAIADAYGLDENGNIRDPHKVWEDGPEGGGDNFNPTIAREALREIVKKASQQLSASQRGLLPGYLQEAIEASMQDTAVPWPLVLRRITARMGGVSISKTVTRKHKNLGVRPGTRLKPTWRLAVFIDESFSIIDSQWVQFRSEIHHIWLMGAEITIVCHNADITRVYEYNGRNLHKQRAGGGTDHTPCIEWLNKGRYDGAIFLTDGETAVREGTRPRPGCKAVWVITPNGMNPVNHKHTNITWGSVVRMKPFGKKKVA